MRASVGRIGPTLDPLILLHAIEGAHQRHRIGVAQLRQACLTDALVAREVTKHLTLRQREFELARVALKVGSIQPRHVAHQKAEVAQPISRRRDGGCLDGSHARYNNIRYYMRNKASVTPVAYRVS